MVNANGERFVDEGADFRNYTHAKYARRILEQPGQFAWQVFDHKVTHLLRDECRIREVAKVTAPTLEALVKKMDGVNGEGFLREMAAYNACIDVSVPFETYAMTCGITFTFGGLRINTDARSCPPTGRSPRGCMPRVSSWVASSTSTTRAALV